MISEGSFRSEFSLNVPESIFHKLFEETVKELVSKDVVIKKDLNNFCERSRAPTVIRYIIPFQDHLPKSLFLNKEFAREYLKIVFETEGGPIFNLKRRKKYIKLTRNSDVSIFLKGKHLIKEKRVFINEIKNKFFDSYNQIIKKPDNIILGEHILLKYHFGIDSTLKLESIRLNKVGNRKGKISAKWVLYIYSGDDIQKFNQKVGFISKNKIEKCNKILDQIPSRKKKYFALEIMKKIQKKNRFSVKKFNYEMKKMGYVSPQKFIWDYLKNKKLITRVGRAEYRVLDYKKPIF